MTPKFEVGEVVILQSMDHPEMNGEYTVEKFIVQGKRYHDILSNCTVLRTGPSGYSLIGGYAGDVTTTGRPCVTVWCESALRKKHQPGEMSFRDLMQTLKDPSHA